MKANIAKIRFSLPVKLLISAALLLALGRHFWHEDHSLHRDIIFDSARLRSLWHLPALALALMPLNWVLETFKWQQFMSVFQPIGFRKGLEGVLAGVSVSLFTPNRVGEYAGRMLVLERNATAGAIASTLLGSYCQWVVLWVFGSIGIFVWTEKSMHEAAWMRAPLLALALFLAAVAVFLLWRPGRVLPLLWILRPSRFRRMLFRALLPLRHFRGWIALHALGLAALRYGVYGTQYFLLLRYVGVGVPVQEAAAGIAVLFLAQTGVPLPPFAALLARGELALLVWSPYHAGPAQVLAATYGLFTLNLLLPALWGGWVIWQSRWLDKPVS